MKNNKLGYFLSLTLIPILQGFLLPNLGMALDVRTDEKKTSANEMSQKAKKEYEELKEKTCEVFNGKLECKVKKVKTKAKSWMEKMETSSADPENRTE